MHNRVVITGMGVVAPNGVGLDAFWEAMLTAQSGIRFDQQLADLQFSCQISGRPQLTYALISNYMSDLELRNFDASGILYGVIAGMDAWKDAGLDVADANSPDWDSGTIFGCGTSGVDKFRDSIYKIDQLQTRRLGSTAVAQTMGSGVSAYLAGKLGLGNLVTTNSSACTTGTESLLMAFERVKIGKAKRMIAGATTDSGPYIWGGFDAMRVCTFKHNDSPERGSRPMSATASGFVPSSGAGAFVVESLESALERGVHIYAEILGGNLNSGGQRGEGSMTAPNPEAVQRCIKDALEDAGVHPSQIDAVNGHLTATAKDALEVENWSRALGRSGAEFPYLNGFKGVLGHCISAAASVENVATVLQLDRQTLLPNANCEDLNPEVTVWADATRIPMQAKPTPLHIVAKASFGFGDVNGCIIFKKY